MALGLPNYTPYIPSLTETVVAQEMTLMEEAQLNVRTFTPEELEYIARDIAEHKVKKDREKFVLTLSGESMGFAWNEQSLVPANGPNGREDSWGICQIHLPSHPDITKDQALNPYWCMNWTAEQFNEGNASMWSVYRAL